MRPPDRHGGGAFVAAQRNAPGRAWRTFASLDAFAKVSDDFFQRTVSGGIITLVAYAVMLTLFVTETRRWMAVGTAHELAVDSSRGETIQIDFNITFPRMPCSWLSLDAMDVSGELHLDLDHNIFKQRLAPHGEPISEAQRHELKPSEVYQEGAHAHAAAATPSPPPPQEEKPACGSCYGAEDSVHKCCNTCDEVRDAYQRRGWRMLDLSEVKQCAAEAAAQAHSSGGAAPTRPVDDILTHEGEGCRMWGRLLVNKVAGNFHFAAGHSFQQGTVHIHNMAPFAGKTLDFRHEIAHLSFGPQVPGMTNPLDGASSTSFKDSLVDGPHGLGKVGMFQYFLKVVPTVYEDASGAVVTSNQYSVTDHFRESNPHAAGPGGPGSVGPGRTLPGVFFFYDLSPIKVHIVQSRPSFLHYLTNLCAIVGGVFAVSGLLDGAVHRGGALIRKKVQMGKQT